MTNDNRYQFTKQGTSYNGKRVYLTTIYPEIPMSDEDIYITSNQSQRLDQLALKYYNDSNYWWVIAQCNNLGQGSLSIPPGLQLRIPTNIGSIVANFSSANRL